MRNYATVTLTVCSVLALAGCATPDNVLFVTKTSIGVDFDSTPASASIAYDRMEGYIAPRYANGEIPPVVASIKSDARIFNPKIRQVYATGDAAVIAVSDDPSETLAALDPKVFNDIADEKKGYVQKKLKGEKKLMFFGTTTTTGLKVGFTTSLSDSLVFGFKRKEYSFIPLGTQTDTDEPPTTYDVYPSVLASIDSAANAGKADETGKPGGDTSLSNAQFFATGRAARVLAANGAISRSFKDEAKRSLAAENIRQEVQSDIEKIVKQVFHDDSFEKDKFDKRVDSTKMLDSRKDSLKKEASADTTPEALSEILKKSVYSPYLKEMAK